MENPKENEKNWKKRKITHKEKKLREMEKLRITSRNNSKKWENFKN